VFDVRIKKNHVRRRVVRRVADEKTHRHHHILARTRRKRGKLENRVRENGQAQHQSDLSQRQKDTVDVEQGVSGVGVVRSGVAERERDRGRGEHHQGRGEAPRLHRRRDIQDESAVDQDSVGRFLAGRRSGHVLRVHLSQTTGRRPGHVQLANNPAHHARRGSQQREHADVTVPRHRRSGHLLQMGFGHARSVQVDKFKVRVQVVRRFDARGQRSRVTRRQEFHQQNIAVRKYY